MENAVFILDNGQYNSMPSTISQKLSLTAYSSLLKGGLLLMSPVLLFVPKTRAGLKQKFGFIDASLKANLIKCKGCIWIHTVSVGEFNGAYPLIEAIRNKYPHKPLIVSTTTEAGKSLAKKRVGNFAQVIYFPFDLPKIVDYFLTTLEPDLVIIFETELWPNFIDACATKKIPITMVNARMSPRSFSRYKLSKWFFGPIINKLSLVGAQSEAESQRYKEVAGNDLPVQIFGNLKYDWPALLNAEAIENLKIQLGINKNDLVLIAGSTHADEEKVVLNAYKQAVAENSINNNKSIKLIIAPRHPERFDQVAKIIENNGCSAKRYSKNEKLSEPNDVYLLDTIGQLGNFYAIASVAFVGGSIAKVGGHNLLEPYLYAVPVVCGQHLFKTKESATILSKEKALLIGYSDNEVENAILTLLNDAKLREQMGKTGQQWLENNRGAVAKAINAIAGLLESKKNSSIDNEIKIGEKITL